MKRLLLVGATALSTCLGICAMLVVAVPAWAHVVVSPEEVAADDYETLTGVAALALAVLLARRLLG